VVAVAVLVVAVLVVAVLVVAVLMAAVLVVAVAHSEPALLAAVACRDACSKPSPG
jgi:hypothetical protein